MNEIAVRPTTPADASPLCKLLNEIIAIGGTTANEVPETTESFAQKYLLADDRVCCHSAVYEDALVGFQFLGINERLAAGWLDIATFARASNKVRGVGTALFSATLAHVAEADFDAINARIRADNSGGLAYYDKMGFTTYSVDKAVPLADGTPIDRISKRFDLHEYK